MVANVKHFQPIEDAPLKPVSILTAVRRCSDDNYEEPVTESEKLTNALATLAEMAVEDRLARRGEREDRARNKPSELKRLWLPIAAAVTISLGPPLWQANVMTRTGAGELQGAINELKSTIGDVKRDAADAAREAKKANLNNALLDTYNRELERSLIKKGLALPAYPVLEK